MFTLRTLVSSDLLVIKPLIDEHWGGEPLTIRGEKRYPTKLPGIVACQGDTICGYLFYECAGQDCEIVLLHALQKQQGIGSLLIEHVKGLAKEAGCSRLFVMTTNDNLDALRFYQRRGFSLYKVVPNAVNPSRKLLPGRYGIPRRDELYLEA